MLHECTYVQDEDVATSLFVHIIEFHLSKLHRWWRPSLLPLLLQVAKKNLSRHFLLPLTKLYWNENEGIKKQSKYSWIQQARGHISRCTTRLSWGFNWIKQHATQLCIHTLGSVEVKSVMGWPLISPCGTRIEEDTHRKSCTTEPIQGKSRGAYRFRVSPKSLRFDPVQPQDDRCVHSALKFVKTHGSWIQVQGCQFFIRMMSLGR